MIKTEKLIGNKYSSYIAQIKSWKKIAVLMTVISFCYYISLKFVFPGYFDPLMPHHPDFFFTYSGLSSMLWTKVFIYPRPVGFFILKVVGILGLKGVITFLIFCNFLNILLTIIFIKKISNGKIYWPMLFIYLFIIFSQPAFYFNYTYDFFDVMAYFFVLLAMLIWLQIGGKLSPTRLLFLSILIGLSFFSKETYVVTSLIFFAWQFAFRKNEIRRNAAIMLFVVAGIFVMVLIQSHISQSIWVSFASNTNNPYFVNFSPRSIGETFYFYVNGWGNSGALLIIALSLLMVALNKKYLKEFLLLLLMGLTAYIPYSILPNHELGYYFWLGVPLSYGAILLVQPHMINTLLIKIKNKKISITVGAILVFLFIILTACSLKNNKDQESNTFWAQDIQMERINKNILSSFPVLKNNIKENDKILITGIYFSAHPFSCQHDLMDIYFDKKNDFIDNYFGKNHSWTIFEYDKSTDKKCSTINYTNDTNLDLSSYDEVFIFGKDAKLMKVMNRDEIALLKNSKVGNASYYDAILNPKLFDKKNKDIPKNF